MALDDKNMTGKSGSDGMSGQAGTSGSLSGNNVGMGTAGGHSSSGASHTGTGSLSTGSTGQAGFSGNTGNLNSAFDENASSMNWEEEDRYWSENYGTRPYASQQTEYQHIRPAYQYGASAYQQNEGRQFDTLDENALRSGWESQNRTPSEGSDHASMGWEQVKEAVRDAYNRMFDRHSSTSGTTTSAREKELA